MSGRVVAVRRLSALALLLTLGACKTWHPSTVPADRLVSQERPSSLRLTMGSGEILTLKDPIVVGDSIVSPRSGSSTSDFPLPRPGVATEDVQRVEVSRFSTMRTLVFAAATVGASLGWAKAARDSRAGRDGRPPPLPKGLTGALEVGLALTLGLFR